MNTATSHYINQYRTVSGTLPGQHLDWLLAQRNEGLSQFEHVGFPTQRQEDWRYTPLRPITSKQFAAVGDLHDDAEVPDDLVSLGDECIRLVFLDGIYAPRYSLNNQKTEGVTVEALANVLERDPERVRPYLGALKTDIDQGFAALNKAFTRDGAVITIAPGVKLDQVIEVLCVGSGDGVFTQPRNLVVAGDNSRAQIVERYVSVGDHSSLTNSTTEVILDAGSQVDFYLVQQQSNTSFQVCNVRARQSEGSRFSCRTATLGGRLVRNDLVSEMNGESAHCDMLGLYCISGAQHVDNHTTMVHNASHCTSRELYKGVLDQRSRAVFHGRIKVQPGAQKTDAEQANNNLLLSRNAEVDTKPQLEIYADDVKCSHGATVGQIDERSLFYLRSRGIDEKEARSLLTFAFVNDVVSEIHIDELKQMLERSLADRFMKGE